MLFVLRNDLKLTGPRLGCGLAQCGACAVLVDGKEVRSCVTPVSSAVGKRVTTIEGLPAVWAAQKGLSAADAAKTLHPVQQAWIDEQVPQCGYCQSGMMIAACELLAKNPNPTVAEIKDAFTNTPPSPHLCRCGTYCRDHRCRAARCQGHEGVNELVTTSTGSAHAARLRQNWRRSFRLTRNSGGILPPVLLKSRLRLTRAARVVARDPQRQYDSHAHGPYRNRHRHECVLRADDCRGIECPAGGDYAHPGRHRQDSGRRLFGWFLVRRGESFARSPRTRIRRCLELAATQLGVPVSALTVSDGIVSGGGKSISYGQLVQGQHLDLKIPVPASPRGWIRVTDTASLGWMVSRLRETRR